ncbi:ABC transporter ATP-binding protein [Novispirillum itersonii]|uniref:Peptide/nickel transport system ATP-binding protein n=1 Tax=Novispirillum itersonii TaxID=189 RepID=A0A7X0DKF0_NOVIT|nr:ATP-binding cassette domain-containing protein [Novispirillum itersonii]MBB6208890.1 peptide/nickel transport system ATP-binding protein [Novispirillum itersonii]
MTFHSLEAQSVRVRSRQTASPGGADSLLVQPVSLTLRPGHAVTLLGETGSGKSLLAQALIGTLPPTLVAEGEVLLNGVSQLDQPPAARRALWGRTVAVLPQEPWLALDPTMRAGAQVMETRWLVGGLSRRRAWQAAREALRGLDVLAADSRLPGQLSGGMAQRVAFAAAQTGDAPLLVADEPTKGLDVSRRDQVTALLDRHVQAGGALLTITHDPAVARALGGTVVVMRDGAVLEQGPAAEVLFRPAHAFTQALLAADPEGWPRRESAGAPAGQPVLTAREVAVARGGRTLFSGLSLDLAAGEVVGLSGPSGCGKSSFGDVCLGLLEPESGTVQRPAMAPYRWQKLYQDPPAAFAPKVSLRTALMDVVRRHRCDPAAISPLLRRLGLDEALLDRLPSQVSGGELQRLALLRVLLLKPVFLFADEPTSRLDLLTQQETIGLLTAAAREQGCAVLLVSHDRTLLDRVCDRVLTLPAAA